MEALLSEERRKGSDAAAAAASALLALRTSSEEAMGDLRTQLSAAHGSVRSVTAEVREGIAGAWDGLGLL